MDEHTPEKVAELARRLRGDIFDAVPDDGDLQSVLDLAAEAADALAAVSAERDEALEALDKAVPEGWYVVNPRHMAEMKSAEANSDELRSIISEQEKANRRLQSERDEAEANHRRVVRLNNDLVDSKMLLAEERDKAIATGERILADALKVSAERDRLHKAITEIHEWWYSAKAPRVRYSEYLRVTAILRAALDQEGND